MHIDISDLGEIERWIILEQLSRLRDGMKQYGAWKLEDSRDNYFEAVLEVLDRNNYMAHEKLKKERVG